MSSAAEHQQALAKTGLWDAIGEARLDKTWGLGVLCGVAEDE